MSTKWISVNDRLPENDDGVLVWPYPNDETGVITAQYQPFEYNEKWMYSEYEPNYGDSYYETSPSHWQPLPKPPAQEE